jgi:hypothetical protein
MFVVNDKMAWLSKILNGHTFVLLGFNLSNGVTDTLESSSILIYFSKHMSLYTQKVGRMPLRLND